MGAGYTPANLALSHFAPRVLMQRAARGLISVLGEAQPSVAAVEEASALLALTLCIVSGLLVLSWHSAAKNKGAQIGWRTRERGQGREAR